jgi:hypothetical protein
MKTFTVKWNKALLIVLLLGAAPDNVSNACGPIDRSFKGYSFLDGNIISPNITSAPVLLSFETLYAAYGGAAHAQLDENVREWQERICKRARLQDIHDLIYSSPEYVLQSLRAAVTNPSMSMDSELGANTFARYLHRNRCLEIIDYLAFAKRCQPHVIPGDDPWKAPARDTVAMKRLINEAGSLFLDLKSDYIRLRYAYQMIRLAHYAKDYPLTLELYEYLMPKIDHDPSVVEYWIKGHAAGAMLSLGRNVEAAYLYAQVFEHSRGKAESAYRSFRIRTDEEWEACLRMCRSDRERAALYVLRASAQESRAVEEMEKIYRLDPVSPHLEVLLVREIQKLEKDFLGAAFNDNRQQNKRYHNLPRPDAGKYLIRLQEFVMQVAEEKKTPRPALWKIAEGYLELLAGDYYGADRTFRAATAMAKSDTLKAQLNVFKLAMRISAWQKPTEEVEIDMYDIRRKNPYYETFEDFTDFLNDKMTQLYKTNNQPGKAFLIQRPLRDLKPNPQLALIEDLIALCRKPYRTRIERGMVEINDTLTIEHELLNMKGALLMADGRLEAAMEVYKLMPPEAVDQFGRFRPFLGRIFNECVHCPIPDAGGSYNKKELIERLLELEYRANAGVPGTDTLYYELGLAWYNMSWFGHSWKAMDFYRSGASMALQKRLKTKDFIFPHNYYPFGNRENLDCSKAMFYFEKARLLAVEPEFAARAAYMAAKCERNQQDVAAVPSGQRTRHYFDLLRTQYKNTEFFGRTIRECKYFAAYTAR